MSARRRSSPRYFRFVAPIGLTISRAAPADDEARKFIVSQICHGAFTYKAIKDAEGNVIKEAPLPIWANFQQRALGVAIREVNAKTDLKIKLASIDRLKQRRVVALNFTIKTQAIPKGAIRRAPMPNC